MVNYFKIVLLHECRSQTNNKTFCTDFEGNTSSYYDLKITIELNILNQNDKISLMN